MQRDAILNLIQASLGEGGYTLVRTLMKLNGFLGTLVDLPLVMNEFSYQTSLFGVPSLTRPWGWQLYGHHIALNVVIVGSQMVISPVFLGAEPTFADEGELVGFTAFEQRHSLALRLVQSLTPEQLAIARLYDSMRNEKMPPGRLDPLDERHVGGAFQDNRIVPYEGVSVETLNDSQRNLALSIVANYLELLPPGPALARLQDVKAHLAETWLTWIGGTDVSTPLYFRIQSPVILVEFDHHAGVWLKNDRPATFHVHTIMRTPNGNDYGRALVDPLR
jgi:hypothetical protein